MKLGIRNQHLLCAPAKEYRVISGRYLEHAYANRLQTLITATFCEPPSLILQAIYQPICIAILKSSRRVSILKIDISALIHFIGRRWLIDLLPILLWPHHQYFRRL